MELPKAYNLKFFLLGFFLKFNLAVNEMFRNAFLLHLKKICNSYELGSRSYFHCEE